MESDLEGADTVEARPVPPRLIWIDPDWILHLNHGDQPGPDVLVRERDSWCITGGCPAGPGASNAVCLLLGGDGREVEVAVRRFEIG